MQGTGVTGPARCCASLLVLVLLAITPAYAQLTQDRLDSTNRADNADQSRRDPVQIIDNIWWVGHSAVGAFLVTSDEGHILIDTGSAEHATWTAESIVNAGFRLDDIRFILNTHTHEEHMGGMALFRKLVPGAVILVSKESAEVLASGGRTDFRYIVERDETDLFEAVIADGLLKHGDDVTVGDTTLVAHLTPGHTEGTTTWTTTATEDGRDYAVVIFGGMSASGADRVPLVDNAWYPEIAEDFEKSFALLRGLPCDVYLYPRAVSIELDRKVEQRTRSHGGPNPFIDPEGCRKYINFYEERYRKQLNEELGAQSVE